MKNTPKLPLLARPQLIAAAALLLLAPAARADYSSLVLADHPLAYYPLILTNSTAQDLTGNGNDGTYINIAQGVNDVPGPTPYIPNAISFDGSTTYVDLSTGQNSSSLNFGGNITLEAWVQPNSPSANGYIIGKGYDEAYSADEIEMRAPGFGSYQGGTFNSTNGGVVVTGGNITTNWTHVVLTFDGTNWNIYKNASKMASAADTVGAIDFPTSWAIGDGTASGSARIFTGNIAAVGIYSNALSDRQITAHYIYGLNGTTNVAPIISSQPSPVVSVPGNTATFSVSVISALNVTSQWYKNGGPVLNATNLTLTLTNLQTTDSGNYTITVTSSAGSTTSSPANLLVLTPGAYGVSPVALAASSFNYDTIVESGAIPLATTASMDAGVGNYNYGWFEIGWNSQSAGLPNAGSVFASYTQGDHSFQMPPNYTTNNAFMIDSSVQAASMIFSTPAAYSGLSFLLCSGGGGMSVAYTVHHADNSVETGTVYSSDWFGVTNAALLVNGRVDVRSRSVQTWGSGGPSVGSTDISLANSTSPVTKVDLAYTTGGGHACILGVSGSTGSGFTPITVSGFNEDMIVEVGAPGFVGGAYTTASMDNSTGNTQFSWYEDGFEVPGRGVPKQGTGIVSQAQPDHSFDMPASYTNNDVALVDATHNATLTLASPARLWRLSFLGASGHGPVNMTYTVHHADSSTEAGTIALPDWFGGGTIAWAVNGRVDVQSGGLQTWGSGGPRMLSVDIGVTNINSAVNSVDLTFGTGNQSGASAEIMALSGAYINQSRVFTGIQGKPPTITFAGLPGYRYVAQYTTSLTQPVTWTSLGTNTANSSGIWQYTDTNAASHPHAFYRALWLP